MKKDTVILSILFLWIGMISFAQSYTIGFADGYPPYQFKDERGRAAGLDIDLTRALFSELSITPKIVQGRWDDMISMLRRNIELDLVGGMEKSAARQTWFAFSSPLYNRKGVIVVPARDSTIRGIRDLDGKTVTDDKGSMIESLVEKDLGLDRARLITTPSKEAALRLLAEGKVDACLMPEAVALYLSRTIDFPVRLVDVGDKGSPVAFAMSRNDAGFLARLDQGIARLKTSGRLDAILAKWLK